MDGDEHYKKAIEAAEKDLQGWSRLRNASDLKIAQLKSAIAVLQGLLEGPPKASSQEVVMEEVGDMGITEAIRAVLRGGVSVTPANVKEDLVGIGFDLSKYANPSAVIHNTLKRLETQGEITAVKTPSGTAYMLITPSVQRELSEWEIAGMAASDAFSKTFTFADMARQLSESDEAARRFAEAMAVAGTLVPRPPKSPGTGGPKS